ncbi:aliphatic sulfonate ABC transporter substrate-binding protein [Serpentinicella sp. ANB-PHB4]|uniref:ABC transporter substrate-binding protein n=1 Tax=Serpentinicella sp. ANB-PHB4 TaxID=3074076 RepID=UPI0028670896|nr:aliphatic sulfonate ABC transporter substrate-binding protein [Serpentinicella sp. ANB-PHB4]MDR5659241.1 aliphatic sulfonate ABC transporter substrate-binding protein [Serpentinicella sp. ANB-PHB4]
MKKSKVSLLIGILILSLVVITACSTASVDKEIDTVSVGYFPNLSHAPAMVGIEEGFFAEELEGLNLDTMHFPNGSLFMDALSTGQIDIGYVGPGPMINRYLQGGDVVLLSNASVGENVLVMRNDVEYNGVEDLHGKIIATASTGCTHDLLLRKMLQVEGMAVEENGGTVQRVAQRPATNVGMLQQKQLHGALVSEPWASIMEAEGVGRVVVDATEVPWDGNVPATVLVARRSFAEENPEIVEKFLKGHEQAINYLNENEEASIEIIRNQIKEITDQDIAPEIFETSLARVFYRSEIDKDVLQEFADLSKDLGFINGDASLENLFWLE